MQKILKLLPLRFIFDISYFSIANLLVQFFSFLSIFFIARYLGPINIGIFSFIQNYATIFLTIVTGTDYYFSWKISKSKNYNHEIGDYIVFKFIILLFIIITSTIFGYLYLPNDVFKLLLVYSPSLLFLSLSPFYYYALANLQSKLIASVQISLSAILFLVKIILYITQAPLSYFIFTSSLDLTLPFAVLSYFLIKKNGYPKMNFIDAKNTLLLTFNFIKKSQGAILSIFTMQVLLKADQFFLAHISNAYSLGIYSSAVKITEVANIFASILYLAIIGRLADSSKTISIKRKMFFLYAVSGLLIMLLILLCSKYAVKIVYGDKFKDAAIVLFWYSLTIPSMYMFYYYNSITGITEKYFSSSKIFTFGIIVNVILMIVLYPLYGLVGVSISTAIAYFLVVVCFHKIHR